MSDNGNKAECITDLRSRSYAQITRGTLTGVIHSALLLVVGMLLPPVILNHIGDFGYGYWVLCVSLASYVQLFELGLTTGIVKLWAELGDETQLVRAQGAFRVVMVLFSVVSAMAIAASYLLGKLAGFDLTILPWFVLAAGLALCGEPLAGILRGVRKIERVNITNALITALNAALIWYLLTKGFGLHGIAVASICTYALRLIIFLMLTQEFFSSFWSISSAPKGTFRYMLVLGASDQISRVAGIVVAPTTRVILFGILGSTFLASYDLGARLGSAAAMIPTAMLPALLPAFSSLDSVKDSHGFREVLTRASKYVALLGIPCGWFILLFAEPLTTAWLGRESADVALTAQVLLVGALINTLTGPFSQALVGSGRPRLCVEKVILDLILGFTLPIGGGLLWGFKGFLIGQSLAFGLPALIFLWKFDGAEAVHVLRDMVSTVARASLAILPLASLLGLLYVSTRDEPVWQHLWTWAVAFACFAVVAGLTYLWAGLVSRREIHTVRAAIALKT